MNTKAAKWGWLLLGLVLVLGEAHQAQAADLLERVVKNQEIKQVLRLRVGHSKVLRTPFAITRISMADPEIADIILISEKEIYVNALAPGVTNLSIWGKSRFTTTTVTVEADVTLLKEKLHQILPKEKIGVEAAGDSVVLSGEVSGPVAQETAVSLALPFAGGKKEKVVNLLHVGGVQQVMLEVRVAEISRSVLDRIGINANVLTRSGEFGVSQINQLASVTDLARVFGATTFTQIMSPNITALAGITGSGALWTLFFDLLKQQGLGRLLAEPNLVTTSGQEANFLAGGEFPVPVPQSGVGGGSTITIEWKKFGVGLNFTPTVLDGGKISMRVNPEVSELDPTTGVVIQNFNVPGLRVRRVSTNVEVKDGQTFAVAGLLSDSHRNVINKFPLLGDIPILGTLFRSSSYQKNETELVVLVIPHLVKPMAPGAVRLPTDKHVEPTDYEKYLLGYLQGRPRPTTGAPPPAAGPLPLGFGPQAVE
ncbi:MAG TPA: type II and III secretion system protein family protein [Desulfobaccales bacterium]